MVKSDFFRTCGFASFGSGVECFCRFDFGFLFGFFFCFFGIPSFHDFIHGVLGFFSDRGEVIDRLSGGNRNRYERKGGKIKKGLHKFNGDLILGTFGNLSNPKFITDR